MTHKLHTEPWGAIESLGTCSCATWSRIGVTSELYRGHAEHVAEAKAGQRSML